MACRRTVRTPVNENIISATVERELLRSSHNITRELVPSQPTVLEVLHDSQFHPNHYSRRQFIKLLRREHTATFLFYSKFCGRKKRNLGLTMHSASTTVTSGHKIMLAVSAAASVLVLLTSWTLSYIPFC